MEVLDKLQEGLENNHLDCIKGSPFDNSFSTLCQDPIQNNLIVLGTNGNITDAAKTNAEWLSARSEEPCYSHLHDGNWGKSPLQPELLELPNVLNMCYGEELFSEQRMIVTNGLLLASAGVGDINNQFNKIKENGSLHSTVSDLIHASMKFFHHYTMTFAKPKVIFAYGNSESGHSAWRYLRSYFEVIKDAPSVRKTKASSYKFCTVSIDEEEVVVIGSPHLSYHYNKVDGDLIVQGLESLGVI